MKISLIFPGQGSQFVGMGKDFYGSFIEAKDVFSELDYSLNRPLSNIVFSNSEAESIQISFHGILNCYYSSLAATGDSQLTIFNSSINTLQIGDEIGIFDSNAILNYGDCSNNKGELLVGSGIWMGEQLNIVSVGSVDLCNINGVQLSGYVIGNPLVVKVYRPSNGLEYLTELSWETGLGFFGEVIQSIDNINLINSSLSKGLF